MQTYFWLVFALAGLLAACDRVDEQAVPVDMVLVPAGSFMMGSDELDGDGLQQRYGFERPLYVNEHPLHRVSVETFWLDRFEVNNAQYKAFVLATRRPEPPLWVQNGYNVSDAKLESAHVSNLRWIATDYFQLDRDTRQMDKAALLLALQAIQRHRDMLPVSGVSWDDADQYCRWRGKRLPTELEWERAARGDDKRRFAWGDDWDVTIPNTGDQSDGDETLAPVGSFLRDVSPYGVHDMAGNVSEWVLDWYQPYPGSVDDDPFYGHQHRVIRGGSAGLGHYAISVFYRISQRTHAKPTMVSPDVGFRCALDG